jgi:hypothetical protein
MKMERIGKSIDIFRSIAAITLVLQTAYFAVSLGDAFSAVWYGLVGTGLLWPAIFHFLFTEDEFHAYFPRRSYSGWFGLAYRAFPSVIQAATAYIWFGYFVLGKFRG